MDEEATVWKANDPAWTIIPGRREREMVKVLQAPTDTLTGKALVQTGEGLRFYVEAESLLPYNSLVPLRKQSGVITHNEQDRLLCIIATNTERMAAALEKMAVTSEEIVCLIQMRRS